MTATLNSTGVLFGDNTQQNTAARAGVTVVTLTSATPNATLTNASNQVIRVVTNSTKPVGPSITMPNMTTLVPSADVFHIVNTTNQPVALKDAGGTIREYVDAGTTSSIVLLDNSTANGVWSADYPPTVVQGFNSTNTLLNSLRVNSSWYGYSPFTYVRLDATNIAAIWSESMYNISPYSWALYAQLITFNFSTGAVTAGNRLTLASRNNAYSAPSQTYTTADSDGAGHAIVMSTTRANQGGSGVSNYTDVIGLSVSGGTLYASAAQTFSIVGVSFCCSGSIPNMYPIYCGYLGSNSAYAVSFAGSNGLNASTIWVQGYTVTGTTVVTLTASANNTTYSGGSATDASAAYGARTGLTTFTSGANNNVGRAITYSPASNSLTVVTRTNQTRLAIEQASQYKYSSFSTGGFMFGTSVALYGPSVFDITNGGAVGVTTVASTAVTAKTTLNSAYNTATGAQYDSATRTSLNTSGATYVAVSGRYITNDSASATGNFQIASSNPSVAGTPVLLGSSNIVFASGDVLTPTFAQGALATPFTA